jgi:hypothetical protein
MTLIASVLSILGCFLFFVLMYKFKGFENPTISLSFSLFALLTASIYGLAAILEKKLTWYDAVCLVVWVVISALWVYNAITIIRPNTNERPSPACGGGSKNHE